MSEDPPAMPFRLPFGDDDISTFDVVLALVTLAVIGGLVAWAMGWL